jgi:putative hydrolase of the HAD superfamily
MIEKAYKNMLRLNWDGIDTVMLDMDGTLLDKHFDDYFWEVYLPEHYSLLHNITVEAATKKLLALYSQEENSLQWADIFYWSQELNLNLSELKRRINHLINIHPHVPEFLHACRNMGKQLYVVTNAHPQTLAVKLEQTALGAWFDRLICAEEVGFAKEEPQFWHRLQDLLDFNPQRSLFADDTEKVLQAADDFGISNLIHIAQPSSRKAAAYSKKYPSVKAFSQLL